MNLDKFQTLPAVKAYPQHAEAIHRIPDENYCEVSDKTERLSLAGEENVLVQTKNLRTHSAVPAAPGHSEM